MFANCAVDVTSNTLTLTIDLSKQIGPSKSGKTLIIATTAGNKEIPGTDGLVLGLNAYRKR